MAASTIDASVLNSYREIMGEDGDGFIKDIVETFMESSLRLAADLEKAFESKEIEKFNRTAHSLKSNCATMGAVDLAGQYEELEHRSVRGELDSLDHLMKASNQDLIEVRAGLKKLFLD